LKGAHVPQNASRHPHGAPQCQDHDEKKLKSLHPVQDTRKRKIQQKRKEIKIPASCSRHKKKKNPTEKKKNMKNIYSSSISAADISAAVFEKKNPILLSVSEECSTKKSSPVDISSV